MSKCWVCGETATVFPKVIYQGEEYRRLKDFIDWPMAVMGEKQQRGYCDKCAREEFERRKRDREEYVMLKKLLMMERAIRIMEKQSLDIYEYRDAIKAVSEYSSENQQKFDSSHEMIAAIIAIENETIAKIGFKVGAYTVDILLPELKIALEIDGDRHAHKLYYDNERDKAIRIELGKEWEVVRIRTEYIEENAELIIEAAKTIREEKQRIRKENAGILPEWYSKREASKKPRKQNYGDELLL